ncbi:hypothetical protein D3C71_1365310 [compost metagenome]
MAKARPAEDGFRHHGTFQKAGIGECENRDELYGNRREGVPPDNGHCRKPLGTGGNDIFALQRIDHEGACHAGDIGHAEIGKDADGLHHMGDGVVKRVPVAGKQRIDRHQAGDRRDHAVIDNVLPARSGCDAKRGVKYQQRNQRQHEDGHGMAGKADDADDLVRQLTLLHGGPYAERNADQRSENECCRSKLEGGGENALDIDPDRVAGQDGIAEITVQHLRHIVEKLNDQWLVQAHFGPNPHNDVFRRVVADCRNDGIDRHDAPDQEGDDHQTEQRQDDAAQYRRYAFNALVQCHAFFASW